MTYNQYIVKRNLKNNAEIGNSQLENFSTVLRIKIDLKL